MLLLRDDTNLTEVILILEFYDPEKAQNFVSDPKLTTVKLIILWRIKFSFVSLNKNQSYSIKLSQEEVSELMAIINKGSHTTQKFRAAYIF
tara:strand:- start:3454 stop:3726 length:273 start_codon:yes stop_codon:yes gene_type:complete